MASWKKQLKTNYSHERYDAKPAQQIPPIEVRSAAGATAMICIEQPLISAPRASIEGSKETFAAMRVAVANWHKTDIAPTAAFGIKPDIEASCRGVSFIPHCCRWQPDLA